MAQYKKPKKPKKPADKPYQASSINYSEEIPKLRINIEALKSLADEYYLDHYEPDEQEEEYTLLIRQHSRLSALLADNHIDIDSS